MKKILLIALVFINLLPYLSYNNTIYAESDNKEEKKILKENDLNFGLGLQLFGSTFSGGWIDYSITKHINIELGVGYLGYYAGLRYFFEKIKSNWNLYLGCNYSKLMLGPTVNTIYMPIGYEYISESNFTFSGELAAFLMINAYPPFFLLGALKIGYLF
ncbi:MAG: hypothetical protein OEZ13_12220 [Spirochaetia bacterium]|nr:hypothetical protein [Spirochaetia bacterium]